MNFSMKNGYGQEIRWVLAEDWFAWAKEKFPEKHAEIEAWYTRVREKQKPRVIGEVTSGCRAVVPAEMITDPWTGQPRVFTAEERAKYDLANRGWSPEQRERIASFE